MVKFRNIMVKQTLFAFVFTITYSIQSQNTRVISFEEALHLALKNNIDIKRSTNNLNVDKAVFNASKLSFLPELRATSNGAKTKGFQFSPQEQSLVDQEITTLRVNLRADLVVFNGLNRLYTLKRNKKTYAAQQDALQQLKQDIVFETTQRYLQYLLDDEVLAIAKENEITNSKIYNQVAAFVNQGRRAGVDSISQSSVYERSKLEATNALNKLAIDRLNLERLLALDVSDSVFFVSPKESFIVDTLNLNANSLIEKAYNLRADLSQLENEKLEQKYQANAFRSGRLPRASIFYRYGSEFISNRTRTNQDTGLREDVPFRTQIFEENIVNQYGFNVSIPLFANFSNRGNIVRAKIAYENKDYEIADLKRRIAIDIKNALNNLEQLKQSYKVSKKVSKASKLAFDKQRELYTLGLGDLVALNIEAQRNFKAQSEELQAKYTLIFQQKMIDYQVGVILEQL